MRTTLLLLYLQLAVLTFLHAQYSSYDTTSYIFKLSSNEARALFQDQNGLEEAYFHTLVDSFHFRASPLLPQSYPKGHYLVARAQGEDINVSFESVNTISAVILPNKRDLLIQVYDSLGQQIKDAKITIAQKNIPFNAKKGGYFKSKWKKEAFVEINAANETLFYQLKKKNGRWNLFRERYRYFSRGRLGRILTTPIRWGKGIYNYVRGAIKYQNFTPPLFHRIGDKWNEKFDYKGYTAIQQPKYQPNDTVKIKAYITNHRGKPLKKDLHLKLTKSRGSKPYFDLPISPDKNGNYTHEFVLSDSLQLDQSYLLTFYDKKKRYCRSDFSQQFRYEDYQLDEVTWQLEIPEDSYQNGERIILFAEGKDANDNTIPDGQIELILTSSNVQQHFDNPSYIPDTLWQWKGSLRARGKTQIIVPDSILPNANMKILAQASFVNANGERSKKINSFRINKNLERIETDIQNGYLYATYYKNRKVIDTTGVLTTSLKDALQLSTTETVQFPLKKRINPYVMEYEVKLGQVNESISLSSNYMSGISPNISINGSWKEGVAQFQLNNPHQIPVHYTIQTKNQVVLRDSSSTSETIFSKSKHQGAYFIQYSYVWGGTTHDEESSLQPYKQQLSIKVNQASKVRPGDLVNTEIEVLDYKGNSVQGVNLTAGAINAQFKKINNFSTPKISYKRKRKPFQFTNFELEAASLNLKKPPLTEKFYSDFNLEDHLFYKARFDNPNGIILQYDSLSNAKFSELAQVAPYLIENGKEVPIHLIYINQKLVYYAGTTIPRPYSFLGFEGKNTITLRTRDQEYKFREVVLKKGYKLEMIVNLNTLWQSDFKEKSAVYNIQQTLSLQEKKLLNRSLFQYNNISFYGAKKYIWQENEPVFIIPKHLGYKKNLILGPLTTSQPTGFVVENKFIRDFVNTPHYVFDIFPTREQLIKNKLFDLQEKFTLPKIRAVNSLGQVVFTTQDIKTQTPQYKEFQFGTSNFEQKENSGDYQYKIKQDSQLIAIIITNEDDDVLRILKPNIHKLSNLATANYHLYLFTKNDYYSKHSFRIKANHLLYEDLSDVVYQKDSLQEQLLRFITIEEAPPQRQMDDYTAHFFNKKQQGIIGQIKTPHPDSIAQIFELQLLKDDLLVTQTRTDSSGYYQLSCYPGIYQLNVVHTANKSSFEFPIFVTDSSLVRLDLVYHQKAFYLNQVEVIGYRISYLKQDNSKMSISAPLTIESREIVALKGKVAGINIDDRSDIRIRGSRSVDTQYYVDGSNISAVDLTEEISGTIKDASGEVLIGCSVLLKVNDKLIGGTITDIDGFYTLKVPDGPFELEISYVGYKSYKVETNALSNEFDFSLNESDVLLDEVVVVGYGIQRSTSSPVRVSALDFDAPPPLEGGIQLRSDFKDYAYWQPNLITDKNGKASFQTVFPDKLTSWRTFVIGMDRKTRAGVGYSNTQSFKPLVAQLAIPRFLVAGDQSNIIGKSVNYTQDTYPVETQFLQENQVLQSNQENIKEALIESTKIIAPIDVDSISLTYKLQTGDYGDGEKRQIPVFPNGIEETNGAFHLLEGDTSLTLQFDPKKAPITLYTQSDVLELMLEDLDYLVKYPYGCNEQTASRLIALLLEKQVREQLNQPFEHEDKIIKMIVRLKKNQNKDGSWGWWTGNQSSNWITIHVLKALAQAKTAGYSTKALDKGLRYITNFLPTSTPSQQIDILELLSSINQQTNYADYFTKLDSMKWGLEEQYTIIKIKQEQNLPYQLDSLEAYRRSNLFGGSYWGKKSWNIISEDVKLSLLAYQIYQNTGNEARTRSIRQFFLMRRSELSQTYGRRFGRNTYETAKIIATLLPDYLLQTPSNGLKANELTILGNDAETITDFPFKKTLNGQKSIRIQKTGTGILFLTAYQQFLNPSPSPKRDLFDIQTQLLQNGEKVSELTQGERVQLVVEVTVAKDTEYAMLEIPIPAACSYYSKPNYRRGVEVHREYFKNKTAIFCRKLPKGDYQFKIDLEVRFAGDYTLLPVKVEQMYFPVFYGRNGVKKVKVE